MGQITDLLVIMVGGEVFAYSKSVQPLSAWGHSYYCALVRGALI